MTNQTGIPLGHTITAHHAFGWCSYCPDHTVEEELAAWQTRQPVDLPTQPTGEADMLPAWLHQRFAYDGVDWDRLNEDDREYWEHQARAVRRAVARSGFKRHATSA